MPSPSARAADSSSPVAVTASGAPAETSITNNQTQGVDEGDIVKHRGDLLIILRRGRIFTVSIAGGRMRPVDQIDVTPPGSPPSTSDWYDEMLVTADRVIVIGYSYRRGGSDIYRFRIGPGGRLSFEDAYQLRSADYYSERNYASRMIGNELILYTPLPLSWQNDPMETMPAIRRWRAVDEDGDRRRGYQRIAQSTDIYVPAWRRDTEDARITTLHTVTRCDVTAPVFRCRAIGVLGTDSRTFYVSQTAVYVWTAQDPNASDSQRDAASLLYRMPLDPRARPTALGVRGTPIDQFSFREDAADGVLNVMVRSDGDGDAMWRASFTSGKLAFARLPLRAFGNGRSDADPRLYRMLPEPENSWSLHDRYAGAYLLYGAEGGSRSERTLFAVPVRGGPITRLPLRHGVDRIEALGSDALVVGSTDNNMTMTSIELTAGPRPRTGDIYVRREASEGENRSHGFFYRPDPDSPDGANGILGLPIMKAGASRYASLFRESASMLFLRRAERRLSPLGELDAAQTGIVDDGCTASCVDWYGNARPIFIGGRVFALLGYELVEGEVRGGAIREIGRTSFAPERR